MSWHGQPRRVSVLAEMALRQEKVSERLRELRERQGLSQEDAARKVGITHRQWQRWETGASMPYPRNLDAVASAFGISVAEFFDPAEPVVDDSQLARIEEKLNDLLGRIDGLPDIVNRLVSDLLAASGDADAQVPPDSSGPSHRTPAAPRKPRARGKRKAG
jgi:transcriptional regulator with XRE-family HTH domain